MYIHQITCYVVDEPGTLMPCVDDSPECIAKRLEIKQKLKKETERKNKEKRKICEKLFFMLANYYYISELVEGHSYHDLSLFSVYITQGYGGISTEISCLQFFDELICEERNYFGGTRVSRVFKSLEEVVNYILTYYPPNH